MTAREAIKHWNIGKTESIRYVETGIFNETYIAKTDWGTFVLQKLHPLISHTGPTENYITVAKLLIEKGIPAQIAIPSKHSKLLVADGERSWRLLAAIPGDVYTVANSIKIVKEAGARLGKFHNALKNFKGKLKKTLPMFQYNNVLKNLKRNSRTLLLDANKEVRNAAQFLLERFPNLFLPKNLPRRLIHTDPKISNFIFDKSGNATAMIDMDTIQCLSPLYDIGDAIRSLCGKEEDDPKNSFNFKKYEAFLRGYHSTAKKYLSPRERKLIPRATGLVILGLSARFLNDYVDDFYFGWNPKKYKSRKEHNLARAFGQIALYKDFLRKIN